MKFIGYILAVAVCACHCPAVAQQIDQWPASQRYVADEVVAVVGSSMVLLSDLRMAEDYIKQSYIERGYTGADPEAEALETILVQKLLASQAAIDSLTINTSQVDDQVEAQLDAYVRSKGSVKAVEDYFNRPIFSVRDHLRRRLTESEMARAMKNKVEEDRTVYQAVIPPEE